MKLESENPHGCEYDSDVKYKFFNPTQCGCCKKECEYTKDLVYKNKNFCSVECFNKYIYGSLE